METKRKTAKVAVSLLALAGLAVFSLFAVGGSLEPSAPPGPTMKTLDEVEPRVAIHASDLPLTITEPNSYYLVEDISFASTANHAITIECNDVTIDLMGYTLKGPDSGATSGIYMMYGRTNVEIRNGTVRDFYRGIREGNTAGRQHRIINVRAMSNAYSGIYLLGYGHLIKDCTVAENSSHGIYAGGDSTLTGNTAYNNGTYGIYTGSGSTVTGNTANQNTEDGIKVIGECGVTDNICYNNGYAGIHATSSNNRIERNNITNNDRGVDVDGSGNYVADNTVKGNTDNYDIVAGNQLNILLCEVPETIDWPATVTLAGSLTCAVVDAHAITVEANDVTIDLGGHALIGPDSGTGDGIYMDGRSNVEIRNGTIRDFYYGICETNSSGKDHRVIDVRSVSNGRHGIYLYGKSHLVKDCTASDNGTSAIDYVYGIYANYGSTVTGNTARDNGDSATGNVYGIKAGGGSTVTGNTAYSNGNSATGGHIYGIYAHHGSTVTGNTAYSNGYLAGGYVYGIYAGDGSTVTGNTARQNGYLATGSSVYGIKADVGSTLTGNTAHYNGNSATSNVYGIYAEGGSKVTGNTAYDNGNSATGVVYGILAGAGSTVTGNTANSNGISAGGTVYGIWLSGNNLVDQNTAYNNNGTNMNDPGTCTFGTNHAP